MSDVKRLRDSLLEGIYKKMYKDDRIFFLSDDMGAPVLDDMKKDFKDRFINVGIAEQSMINVATGLGLEGYTVYTYAIAPFFLRCYEQIRINLALSHHVRPLNVNMIGVGTGVSYDVSGPTHHCLEDTIIMRALPNVDVFSPCDWVTSKNFVDYSIKTKRPKYIRLDGKPHPRVYKEDEKFDWGLGFKELKKGKNNCIVSTGHMTHVALDIIKKSGLKNIGLIDAFLLKPFNEDMMYKALKEYKNVMVLEEAFIDKGGLDTIMLNMLNNKDSGIKLKRIGFSDEYLFKYGSRDFLYGLNGFNEANLIKTMTKFFK